MPLDPQVATMLQQLALLGTPKLPTLTPSEARMQTELIRPLAGEPIAVGSVRDITIPVDGAVIGARVYTPVGEGPHPVVVFFHGGGWVICSLDTHDNLARSICRDADAVVVSVDYRMGPEHRFPTAVNDCYEAATWVAENASSLGADASRLAVCGDSAGGNLSAVVSQMARDRRGPTISFVALIYPAVDMTAKGGSLDENATGYFLESAHMEWYMSHYISDAERSDVLASPLLNGNLAGLPACFIATCEYDPLRDEGEAYADALRANGVHVAAKRYDGLIHAAANLTGVLDAGRQLVADVSAHLHAALHT